MNVLAIGCHPDDIEIACSGTLAKCVKRGDRVIACHVSTGNLGHVIIPPDELTMIRSEEAKKAGSLAGVEVLHCDFNDLDIFDSCKEARDQIVDVIRYADPDFIITHNSDDYIIYEKDENNSIYNCSLSHYYLMISKLYCYENKYDEAMNNLLISENCAKVYDNNLTLGEQKYKSVFLNRLTWNPQKIVTNSDKTLCEELLLNLNENCFDRLKDNAEFIALKERLENSN